MREAAQVVRSVAQAAGGGEHEVRARGERVEVELVAIRHAHQQVELAVHRVLLYDLSVLCRGLGSKGAVDDRDSTRRRRHRTEAPAQPAARPARLQDGSQHARSFEDVRHREDTA